MRATSKTGQPPSCAGVDPAATAAVRVARPSVRGFASFVAVILGFLGTGSMPSDLPIGGISAAQAAPARTHFERWAATAESLEALCAYDLDLEHAADLLRRSDASVDSLARHLSARGLDANPPADSALHAWIHARILEGLVHAEPRFDGFLDHDPEPVRLQGWDPRGLWTLPVAVALDARGEPERALLWLDRAALPEAERPYAVGLRLESILATGDTLAAGATASRLRLEGGWPEWVERSLHRVLVRRALALDDSLEVERALDEYEVALESDLFLAQARDRHVRRHGRMAESDSLRWRWARRAPASGLAGRLLRDAERVTFLGLDADELRTLADVAEARRDLDRFTTLLELLRPQVPPEEADTLVLRGAELAYRTRTYAFLIERAESGRWNARATEPGAFDLVLGRAYRNSGNPDSMAAAFARVVDRGRRGQRQTAYWEWGRELESNRHFREAEEVYESMLLSGAGEKTHAAYYRLGLVRYQQEHYDAAIRAWDEALRHADLEWERAQANFWIYRAHRAVGRDDEAEVALRRAADASEGYYSRRARSELTFRANGAGNGDPDREYWPRVAELARSAALTELRAPASACADAVWMSRFGRLSSELRRAALLLQLFRQYGHESWAAVALDHLDQMGELGSGVARLHRLERLGLPDLAARRAIRTGEPDLAFRYPTPYAPEVAGALANQSLAPELIWSIMRRESFFEATVRSHAGAVGLMQFMSPTAEEVGRDHGLPHQPLRSPRVNLRLGAAHLAEMEDEVGGRWPVVLAGYNAGMHNADRWIHPDDDLDVFIEMIGYRETRDYVKAVLEAFWIYRELLRGRSAGAP